MNLRHLQRAPFRLITGDLAWVETTFARLSTRERLAQLIVPLALDTSAPNLDRFAALGFGGVFRLLNRPPEDMRAEAIRLRAASAVPPFLCGDLEFGELNPIGGAEGTAFPNPLAASAAGIRAVERLATIAAIEGRAAGFNWSFTPVADLDFNRHNPVVSTRSFGNDPRHVAQCVRRYVEVLQRRGLAACAKHWPGDGAGDLDQHHTTSINPLPRAEWELTYGRTFRAAIRGGVWSVMCGHIALPAWPGAGRKPASLSRELNLDLLRRKLGFNGVIISDATMMAGLAAHAPREQLVPQVIAHGCDVLLFPVDPELDLDYLARAVAARRLSASRVDEAVLRVLALKAALGLHRKARPPQPLPPTTMRRHTRWAKETARDAVTLVRDRPGLLPLHPRRHRRLLLVQQEGRSNWYGPLPPLEFEHLLRAAGFEVTRFREESQVRRELFDVAVWVTAEEALAGKRTLTIHWEQMLGGVLQSMVRTWPELPTVFISLGHPWHVREVEGCPVVINAYSPVPAMQAAVVAALTGRTRFRGVSSVRLGRHD